jgi:hypothetical protein
MQIFPLPDAATAAPVPAPDRLDPFGPLRRPAVLIRAARAGAALYRRDRHLKGFGAAIASPRRPAREVAERLAALEAECEAQRRAGAPDYQAQRHVLLLSALLAERATALCTAG